MNQGDVPSLTETFFFYNLGLTEACIIQFHLRHTCAIQNHWLLCNGETECKGEEPGMVPGGSFWRAAVQRFSVLRSLERAFFYENYPCAIHFEVDYSQL